jgi:hypothetical protein
VGKENKYLILKEEYGFVHACKKAWLCDWPILGLVPGRAITEWKNINWEI